MVNLNKAIMIKNALEPEGDTYNSEPQTSITGSGSSLSSPITPPPSSSDIAANNLSARDDINVTMKMFDENFSFDRYIVMQIPLFKDSLLPPDYEGPGEHLDSAPNRLYSANVKDVTFKSHDCWSLKVRNKKVTKNAFKLMLKRLNGLPDINGEEKIPFELLYTGLFFGVLTAAELSLKNLIVKKDLSLSMVESLLNQLTKGNEPLYGLIVEGTVQYYSSNGWEIGVHGWDSVPYRIIERIIKSQQFYLPSEFDRAMFIIKLIKRRQDLKGEKNENINRLREVLNKNIIYCNISADRLIELGECNDSKGNPYIKSSVIKNAIKMSFEIAHSISATTKNYISSDSSFKKFESGGAYFDYGDYDYILQKNKYIQKLQDLKVPPIRLSFKLLHSKAHSDSVVTSEVFFYAGSYWSVGILPVKKQGRQELGCILQRMSKFSDKKRIFNAAVGNELTDTSSQDISNYNEIIAPLNIFFDCEERSIDKYDIAPKLCFHDERESIRVYLVVNLVYDYKDQTESSCITAFMDVDSDSHQLETVYKEGFPDLQDMMFLKFNIALGLL